MDKILANKTILITGGTSRLGREFVEKALLAGAKVYLTYHQDSETASRLSEKGAECFRLDLSRSEDIASFAKNFRDQKIIFDAVIHNAAAIRDRTIMNMSEEDWDTVFTVNLKAPYLLTKELLPLWLKDKSGKEKKVFMLTSRTAFTGGFGVSNYSAAKAGLIGLMKSMAKELGKRRILVNAINPGFMKSAMTETMPEEAVQKNLEASPLHQYSNPEEVADFLVFLCSDQMKNVTGQVFSYESRGAA